MKTLQTEITINAPAPQVWEALMNHNGYPNWNPFIKKISGKPSVGSTISVSLQMEGQKPMEFRPTVLKNEKEKEFRWLGHLFVKGLFDGEHFFKLEVIDAQKTRFIHGEHFKGLLAGALLKMIGDNTMAAFNAMNNALKQKVESETV